VNSKTFFAEAVASLSAPCGPRALLVTLTDDGALAHQPVQFGQSVLNIETELRSHLTDRPRSDEWLVGLRDFLSDWITAREDARKFGGLVVQTDDDSSMGMRRL
jgi:hypothetical protein